MNVVTNKKKLRNVKEVLEELKKQLNLTTDKEICDLLGVKPNTFSAWKKRDTLDFKLVLDLAVTHHINLNSLFVSTKESQNQPAPTYLIPACHTHQYTIGLIDDLSVFPSFMLSDSPIPSRIFQVTSNNMEPSVKQNEFVLCEWIEQKDLKAGNIIIIISKKKGFFLNRLVKVEENILTLENENHNPITNKQFFRFNLADADELWIVDVVSHVVNESKNWRGSSLL